MRQITSRSDHDTPRSAVATPPSPRNDRRLLRLLVEHHRGLFGRGAPLQVDRHPAREQLVEDRAQRVDVGMHALPFAQELLGRRVSRRHEPQLGTRPLDSRLHRLERLRDPEVEQLGPACSRHQDVRRLEITVHHRVLVRVLHRLAHLAEQLDSRADREVLHGAEPRHRLAVDVLHREPWRAVGQRVGIEQSRDRRVLEPRSGRGAPARATHREGS